MYCLTQSPQTFAPFQKPDSVCPTVRFQLNASCTCCLDFLPGQAFLVGTP
ncbi:MAG: hypothetical protein IM490_15895 [Microcystis sp. M054S2]|nr:hypothetical protein [Microcystis sp. M054S2]